MKNKDNILSAVKDSMRIDKVMKKENLFNKIGEKNKSEMEKQEDNETSDTEGKSAESRIPLMEHKYLPPLISFCFFSLVLCLF